VAVEVFSKEHIPIIRVNIASLIIKGA